ncbi:MULTISPECIES: glycoside hydrolase [Acidobacteriaceae]|uniref:glycoside hydrolase n=1 Tax=Acidobacteriaceae TaxID=204434 RepID=UPI00131E5333|nr:MULTISPECIES: glycoside hydrolase [Acidobacteriaceae]MDW5266732.1 glycoside hydrolase [Edaphobacter sp.]
MLENKLSRRQFLQTTASTAAAASLLSALPAFAEPGKSATEAYPENGVLIPDEGWHLWIDEQAEWKNDAIFLPEDVRLDKLPVNAPTGGWEVLAPTTGKEVVLPTSVEQHFWGKFRDRSYTPDEYRYAADDPIPQNGAYFGVSWWYREIDIPASMRGKRIFLHIRGAHLRAEVYLNKKLVGYSIMEELPFECDLTNAADPGGLNIIAIRITNPFGRFDWVDGLNAQWGAVKLYRSHGFGALDRGMTISAHDGAVRITDLWVLNTPQEKTVRVLFDFRPNVPELRCSGDCPGGAPVAPKYEVINPRNGEVMDISVKHDGLVGRQSSVLITCASAKQWELETPVLYHLRLTIKGFDGHTDTRTIAFGFRWFAPSGLGTHAIFRLNGRRIKIYTSISWGYWGLNGMFPVPELAEKEVKQAKKLNLNCLNFHRNLAKEEVLRVHDQLGLLRYMEPGAGKMAIGKLPSNVQANAASIVMEKPVSVADKFAQRYMFVKCVEMVKAYRSHPSVIEYCLQNEIGADLKNPDTIAVLEAMRAEDPSRCIVLNDGFVAPPRRAAQAWFEPYNPKLHRSDEEPWGGWWNQHQGAGDQWYDEFYKSPTEFTYRSPVHAQLSEFGEMEGCATPDNHSLMIHQITDTYKKYGGDSYDLKDHEEIVAAYDKFIDRWNFREAFPVTEHLWLSIGSKCYDTWQNYLENARISDDLDFAAISGWESTAIENHSGIVDNLRNFKSDPTPISGTLLPVRPVAKQRAICTPLGERAVFDLYLLNDTPKAVTGMLTFTMITPSGRRTVLTSLPAPQHVPDQFSYLLQEAFETPALNEEGRYQFRFALSSEPLSTQSKDIWVADTKHRQKKPLSIAVSGIPLSLREQLAALPDVTVHDFTAWRRYDAIVSSGMTAHTSSEQNAGDTTGLEAQPGAKKAIPGRKLEPGEAVATTELGTLADGIIEAVRKGTPLFAIPQADSLSDGVAKELSAAEAFTYNGTVGDFRAPWMGNWYFVRKHPLYEGLPVDQVMGIHYQAKGRQSNGLLVDGKEVEIIAAYSRDHDRNIGAGTFTTRLGSTKVLYHRVPELQPVMQQRLLANALAWLTT